MNDDREQFLGELAMALVFGPFVLALALLGCSLAAMSARFLFDVALSAGRFPVPNAVERR